MNYLKGLIICSMFIIASSYASWTNHLWSAEEVRKHQPRNIDLIGKPWWYRFDKNLTNEVSNIENVGKKPLYYKMIISPKPYVPGSGRYGSAYIRVSTDLTNEDKWINLGRYKNWEAIKPWREITIPIWDEALAKEIREADAVFMDVGDLTLIHKWVMYDGDNTTILIDHITPKPVSPTQEFINIKLTQSLNVLNPKTEDSGPPLPGK